MVLFWVIKTHKDKDTRCTCVQGPPDNSSPKRDHHLENSPHVLRKTYQDFLSTVVVYHLGKSTYVKPYPFWVSQWCGIRHPAAIRLLQWATCLRRSPPREVLRIGASGRSSVGSWLRWREAPIRHPRFRTLAMHSSCHFLISSDVALLCFASLAQPCNTTPFHKHRAALHQEPRRARLEALRVCFERLVQLGR